MVGIKQVDIDKLGVVSLVVKVKHLHALTMEETANIRSLMEAESNLAY